MGVLRGHPPGVALIAVVEVWERFSYYGMRGLLVLFLVAPTAMGGFGWSAAEAIGFYGTYTALVYLAPLLGGYIGDRFIGSRRSLILGGALMAAGHITMTGPAIVPWLLGHLYAAPIQQMLARPQCPTPGNLWLDPASAQALERCTVELATRGAPSWVPDFAYYSTGVSFYLAISLIILGTGFFKPNSYTLLGSLYTRSDPKREQGFYIFQMGVNIGACLSNLVVGSVGERLGWHVGFSIAGIGMIIGLAIFCAGQGRFLDKHIARDVAASTVETESARADRRWIWTLSFLALVLAFYWLCAEQAGGLLTLFAADHVDREVFGFIVPVSWFLSLNPLFIILFAPATMILWAAIRSVRGFEWPSTAKFALGFGFTAAGFLVLVLATIGQTGTAAKASPLWLIAAYLLITLGELCINPVALNLANRSAPRGREAMVIAIVLAAVAVGNYGSGLVGSLIEHHDHITIFGGLAGLCAAIGLLLVLAPRLRRADHAIRGSGT